MRQLRTPETWLISTTYDWQSQRISCSVRSIPGPLPPHVINDNVVTFSYRMDDVDAVRTRHREDAQIIRQAVAEADKAVASYNSMLETEIRTAITEGKQSAERRRKFLQDLDS